MARYDYACEACGSVRRDVFHLMSECDSHVEVCECGSSMRRQVNVGVRLVGFTGRATMNPNVVRTMETGEPTGLRRSDPGYVR